MRDKSRRRWRRWLLLGLIPFAIGGGGALAVRAASLRVYMVPSGSMSPTITAGDRVCVDQYVGQKPKRGEIWIVLMPIGNGQAMSHAVKRIVGLPGETIEVASGKLLINGEPLEEPYLRTPPSYTMPPRTLAADEYFALGDSRNTSSDSHIWGPVPKDRLVGKVLKSSSPCVPRRAGA